VAGKPADPVVAAPPVEGAAPVAQTRPSERTVTLATARYRVILSSYGAVARSWELFDPQYREQRGGVEGPVDLVREPALEGALLRTTFPRSSFQVAADAAYDVVAQTATSVTFLHRGVGGVEVTKRFDLDPQRYGLMLTVGVRNGGQRPIAEHVELTLAGLQRPGEGKRSMFGSTGKVTEVVCAVGGKVQRVGADKVRQERPSWVGDVAWIGVDEKYFLKAAAPQGEAGLQKCGSGTAGPDQATIVSSVELAERTVDPGKSAEHTFAVYVGPKVVEQLETVAVRGSGPTLDKSVDFGRFEFIARPLLKLMRAFHAATGNWGVAIILVTLFVRLATAYWTNKSMVSSKAMQRIKPEMDKLREKLGDDKQKLNTEVMNLYKKHKINPVAGCLPMLLQMPIWFALYSTLWNSVELYHAPFALWIHDLSEPDKYLVLPISMGLLMLAQQKWAPMTSIDTAQQKMMTYMMPVMFTSFSLFVPAGLTLYWATSTALQMVHQVLFNRWWARRESSSVLAAAR
jgi:YidC/Oxa1 family membrane protein insertase